MPARDLGDIIRVLLGDKGMCSDVIMPVGDAEPSSSCTTVAKFSFLIASP